MDDLKPKNFSYPHIKADLDLCENQIDALCGARPVDEATLHIPAVEKDFDMQFNAALEELKAYRKTGFTPEELSRRTEQENKPDVSEISIVKAIKRIEDLIRILDIRIGWGDAPADILSEKHDYELVIVTLRNYVPQPENEPLTLEQVKHLKPGTPVTIVCNDRLERVDEFGITFELDYWGDKDIADGTIKVYAHKPEGSEHP